MPDIYALDTHTNTKTRLYKVQSTLLCVFRLTPDNVARVGSFSLATSLLSILPKVLPPTSKDLIKVILRPPNIRTQTGKLPHAIDLSVPVLVGGVGVALGGDLGALLCRVPVVALMGHAELVVADDLVGGDALPAGGADEVLGFEGGIAEDGRVGDHGEEFLGGHGFPHFVEEGAVVDLHRMGGFLLLVTRGEGKYGEIRCGETREKGRGRRGERRRETVRERERERILPGGLERCIC